MELPGAAYTLDLRFLLVTLVSASPIYRVEGIDVSKNRTSDASKYLVLSASSVTMFLFVTFVGYSGYQ